VKHLPFILFETGACPSTVNHSLCLHRPWPSNEPFSRGAQPDPILSVELAAADSARAFFLPPDYAPSDGKPIPFVIRVLLVRPDTETGSIAMVPGDAGPTVAGLQCWLDLVSKTRGGKPHQAVAMNLFAASFARPTDQHSKGPGFAFANAARICYLFGVNKTQ